MFYHGCVMPSIECATLWRVWGMPCVSCATCRVPSMECATLWRAWGVPCMSCATCCVPSMECATLWRAWGVPCAVYGMRYSLARLRCAVCRVLRAVCCLWNVLLFGAPEVCRMSCVTCRVPSMECATLWRAWGVPYVVCYVPCAVNGGSALH